MINSIFRVLLFTISFFLLLQCKKESDGSLTKPDTSDTIHYGVTARLKDSNWIADSWNVKIKNGHIHFYATRDTGDCFTFSIAGTKAGNYLFYGNSENLAFYTDIDDNTYLSHGISSISETSAVGGTVYISSTEGDSISGSFIFTLYNARQNKFITISQGTFSNLQYSSSNHASGLEAVIKDSEPFTSVFADCIAMQFDKSGISMSFKQNNGDLLEIGLQSLNKGTHEISNTSKNVVNYYTSNFKNTFSSLASPNISGTVNITDTSKNNISGSFSFNLYNPENNEECIFHSGSFKGLILIAKNASSNELNCKTDNNFYTSNYTTANRLIDIIKIVSFDGQNKTRVILYIPKDSVEGPIILSKELKNAFAYYIDETGRMFLSTNGTFEIESNYDNNIIGKFNFDAEFDNNKMTSVSEGYFNINY